MTEPTVSPNPFDPTDPQFATWPHAFEPGRDAAELALVLTTPSIVVPGAGNGEALTKKQSVAMRRALVEPDYQRRMQSLFGEDLTRCYRHTEGVTLYFKQQGRIADLGHTINFFGGMDEQLAAQRIVAMGRERGWETITFTGGASFVEMAMREALKEHFRIVAKGAEQEAILAKVMAERQGGMGAITTPAPVPPGAVSADEYNELAFNELEDLIQQLLPAPAVPSQPTPPVVGPPPAKPAPPPAPIPAPPKLQQVGTLPHFLNMRERLQDRRDRSASKGQRRSPSQPPKGSGPKGP